MTAREAYAVLYQYIMDHGLGGSRLGYFGFMRSLQEWKLRTASRIVGDTDSEDRRS